MSSFIVSFNWLSAAKEKEGQNNEKALPDNNSGGDGGTSSSSPPISGTEQKTSDDDPPPQEIDPSKLEINSRILLKNQDDDNETTLKEATIKKLDLTHDPPQLRVHVDGKRKGILNTIGLEEIHSIIGKRNKSALGRIDSAGSGASNVSTFERNGSTGSGGASNDVVNDLNVLQRLSQLSRIEDKKSSQDDDDDDDLPIISSQEYHTKFCMPRRRKKLRELHRLAGGASVQVVPTLFGGPNRDLSSRNSEGTRMILEDLMSLQQQQQMQIPLPPPQIRNSSMRPPFGQSSSPMDTMNFGNNPNFNSLMVPPFGPGLGRGVNNVDTTSTAATAPTANASGQSGSLPQSAFSALDSLAPELRERMLKLAQPQGEEKDDSPTDADDNAAEKVAESNDKDGSDDKGDGKAEKTEKEDKEGSDEDDGKIETSKCKPKSTKAGKGGAKGKPFEKKLSSGGLSFASGDDKDVGAGAAAKRKRLTDFSNHSDIDLSPSTMKPELFFNMRNSMLDAAAMSLGSGSHRRNVLGPSGMISGSRMLDAAAMSLGSGGQMRNVLTPSGMISGGSSAVGSGAGDLGRNINMLQLMGMNPPPFGRRNVGDSGLASLPFGGGGVNPGTGLQQNPGASSSADNPVDAKARNEALATLKGVEKVQKKADNVPTSATEKTKSSGIKRKESSSSNKTKSSSKKKKAKNALPTKAKATKTTKSDDHKKPKRPFSAYNLFFQLEREFIMGTLSSGGNASDDPLIKVAVEAVDAANEKGEGKGKGISVKVDRKTKNELEEKGLIKDFDLNERLPSGIGCPPQIPVPPRYEHLKLEDNWYCVSRKVKRKHRKTEGSCGFLQLTKMVSSRWKTVDSVDPKVKEWCQKVAEQQLVAYKKDVAEYKELLDKNSASDGDDDTVSVNDAEEDQKKSSVPATARTPNVQTATMGVAASPAVTKSSPFDFGNLQNSFFDSRMSDMGRFSTDIGRFSDIGRFTELSAQLGRKTFNNVIPPGLPQLPLQISRDVSDRLNRLGGGGGGGGLGGRLMDETERRFAALAEQESRRQIQTEMELGSFMRPPLGDGFGPLSRSLGGLGNASGIGSYPSSMMNSGLGGLGNASGIGGYPSSSIMPPRNQRGTSLSNEQMMAEIMMMRNNMANNTAIGLTGSPPRQTTFGVGGKHFGDDDNGKGDGNSNK